MKKMKIQKNLVTKWKKLLFILNGIFAYNFVSFFAPLKPKKLTIVLTYKCNSRCIMCNIWKKKIKDELSKAQWANILEDSIFSKIEEITFTGGEPILHPQFLEIANLFVTKLPRLYKINLISNGLDNKRLINSVKSLLKILDNKNIELLVSVSLDGLYKIHQEIRGVPNAFKKTKESLLALKKLNKDNKFILDSGAVMMNRNIDHISQLQSWLKKYNIHSHLQIVGFHENYISNLSEQSSADFTKKDKGKILKWLDKLSNPCSWRDLRSYYWADLFQMYKFGKNRTTPCPFLYDAFAMDSMGEIYYCLSEKSIGNVLKDGNVSSIYFNKTNLKFRKLMKSNQCLKCNSGCDVSEALAKDVKRYLFFLLTGRTWSKM